jgi:hypothetical protein
MSAAADPITSQLATPRVRATVVKVPDASPGLLIVNGQQKSFTLDNIWKSPVAPAPNMSVDVVLDASGAVASIVVVDSRQLAKEQFNRLSGRIGQLTHAQGSEGAQVAGQVASWILQRFGIVTLATVAAMWIAWFFLPGYKIDLGFLGSQTFTLWEFLGLNLQQLGTVSTSYGIGAWLGIICITLPLAVPLVRDSRARFANVLPLVCTAIEIYAKRAGILRLLEVPGVTDASSALSMQAGSYIVLLAAVVLAARAFRKSA